MTIKSMIHAAMLAGAMALGASAGFWLTAPATAQDNAAPLRVAIHVDENDPQRMNMALNNAQNVRQYYLAQGKTVEIRIVAYGPGLNMLRADTSPVKDRIARMSLEDEHLSFAACDNTRAKMSEAAGGADGSDSGGGADGSVRRGRADRIAAAGLELHPAVIRTDGRRRA